MPETSQSPEVSYENPDKVSIVVDLDERVSAAVRVVDRDPEAIHEATEELIRKYPGSAIMHFAGVDLLREN